MHIKLVIFVHDDDIAIDFFGFKLGFAIEEDTDFLTFDGRCIGSSSVQEVKPGSSLLEPKTQA